MLFAWTTGEPLDLSQVEPGHSHHRDTAKRSFAGRLRVRARRKAGLDSHLVGACTTQTGATIALTTTRYMRYGLVPPSQHRLNRFSLKDLSAAEEGQKRENQLRRQRLKSDKTEHCIT
jgi:hypothetical protein